MKIAIIGAGVSGASLFSILANHSNAKVTLIDAAEEPGTGNSSYFNNSHTLHRGDVETNYTADKAIKARLSAQMIEHWALSLSSTGYGIVCKVPKTLLAVGEEEIERLLEHYDRVKEHYPNLKLIGADELKQLEPDLMHQRGDEQVIALRDSKGYAHANFGKLAHSLVDSVPNHEADKRFYHNVKKIHRVLNVDGKTGNEASSVIIRSQHCAFHADMVVVCAGAKSREMIDIPSIVDLPIGGNYFVANRYSIEGKVYVVQPESAPFAAMHAEGSLGVTTFGPTTLAIPSLERRSISNTLRYVLGLRIGSMRVLARQIAISSDVFAYLLENWLYQLPFLGKVYAARRLRRIVPALKWWHLKRAKRGGVRAQPIHKEHGPILGELNYVEDNGVVMSRLSVGIGATACIYNAIEDAYWLEQNRGLIIDWEGVVGQFGPSVTDCLRLLREA